MKETFSMSLLAFIGNYTWFSLERIYMPRLQLFDSGDKEVLIL